MPYSTIFDVIEERFKNANILFVLVGGFAVNAYQVTRQTLDIDFMIAEDDYSKVKSILETAGCREVHYGKIFARFENKISPYWLVDFIFVDRETCSKIHKDGKQIKIGSRFFTVPSLEHLIAMKLHAIKNDPQKRWHKDMLDIVELIKRNNIKAKEVAFIELCKKYANEDLYREILKGL